MELIINIFIIYYIFVLLSFITLMLGYKLEDISTPIDSGDILICFIPIFNIFICWLFPLFLIIIIFDKMSKLKDQTQLNDSTKNK